MNALAERFADSKIGSVFLYTNEAHPGENYRHLTSMEQKFRHALALRDVWGVSRPIYVDSLDGACHRTYGSQPNMTWIFNRSGLPIYKSDWTDAASVGNAVEYYLDVARRRRERQRLAPFRVERLDYKTQDYERFYAGLEKAGPQAVSDFSTTFPEKRPKGYR